MSKMYPVYLLLLCSTCSTCAGAAPHRGASSRTADETEDAFVCAERKLERLYALRRHRRAHPSSHLTYCFRDVQTARVWRDMVFVSDHSKCETLDRNLPDPDAHRRGQPACVPPDAIERGPRTEDILGSEVARQIDPTYRPRRWRDPATGRELARLLTEASPQLFVAPPENCDVDAPHPHGLDPEHPPFGLAARSRDPEQEILRGEVLMAYVREGRKSLWELGRWCERP